MEIQKATGIVLSSTPSGEADMSAVLFTREYGKRRFAFKGLRKSRKRSLTVTEAGTVSELVYYHHENRESFIVNEFRVLSHHLEIRRDLGKILHLHFMLEVVDRTTAPGDPNKTLFELLAAAVEALSRTDFPVHLSFFFALHLLRIQGLLPDVSACRVCGGTGYARFSIDISDFHPVCAACGRGRDEGGFLFTARAREFMLLSLSRKFGAIDHSLYDREEISGLLFHLCLFIESYFHVGIKSKGLLFSRDF